MADKANATHDAAEVEAPLFIRFISSLSGNVYDELTVDHIADMALVFYSAGGTALGAVVGACIGGAIVAKRPDFSAIFLVVPGCAFLGAILGTLLAMAVLNIRGLIRWDRYEIKRTYRLKPQS